MKFIMAAKKARCQNCISFTRYVLQTLHAEVIYICLFYEPFEICLVKKELYVLKIYSTYVSLTSFMIKYSLTINEGFQLKILQLKNVDILMVINSAESAKLYVQSTKQGVKFS